MLLLERLHVACIQILLFSFNIISENKSADFQKVQDILQSFYKYIDWNNILINN